MAPYIHELSKWPEFTWEYEPLLPLLTSVRHKQGHLKGYMQVLGFDLKNEATLQTLTLDVLKSSEIEGEILDPAQVRSSIARQLGMDIAGLVYSDRHTEGVVEMMLDATQHFNKTLDKERLFDWHAALFPTARSGGQKITVANWRTGAKGPMQVVSGVIGKEKIHFEAPNAKLIEKEMKAFLKWFNKAGSFDSVLKSAIAQLWFVTIHPFEDGNGRIARALSDMLLARADGDKQRFYSMSAQIRIDRKQYYDILEKTQKGNLDITQWLMWYLKCLEDSLKATDQILKRVLTQTAFWDKHLKLVINERQRLMINKLMDGFTGKLTSAKWAKICKCSHDTALRDIQHLLTKKILKKEKAGGRSTSYELRIRN